VSEKSARSPFRWLQVSGLQFCSAESCKRCDEWPSAFYRDLRKIITQYCKGDVHLILLQGDLVFKGGYGAKATERINKWLTEVRQILGNEVPVLAVPGNHDIQRKENFHPVKLWLNEIDKIDAARRTELIENENSDVRQFIQETHENWSTWWRSVRNPAGPVTILPGLLPGDWFATLQHGDLKLGFLGLNSAYGHVDDGSAARAEGKRGTLPLLKSQIARTIPQEHRTSGNLGSFRLVWLATHHPLDWLCEDDRKTFINEEKNLLIGLHSVAHQSHREERDDRPHFRETTEDGETRYRRARTGPLLGPHPDLKPGKQEPGMYFIGEVDLGDSELKFKITPRVFKEGFSKIFGPEYTFPSSWDEPALGSDKKVHFPRQKPSPTIHWRRYGGVALAVTSCLLLVFGVIAGRRWAKDRALTRQTAELNRALDARHYWAAFIRAGWIANGRIERSSRRETTRNALRALSRVASVRRRLPVATIVAEDATIVAATFERGEGTHRRVVGLVHRRGEAALRLRRWTVDSTPNKGVTVTRDEDSAPLGAATQPTQALDLNAEDLGAIFLPPTGNVAPSRVLVHSHCNGAPAESCRYGVWDLSRPDTLRTSSLWSSDGPSPGRGITVSGDGQRALVWDDRNVWDAPTTPGSRFVQHPTPMDDRVQEAVFAPEGGAVLVSFQGGTPPITIPSHEPSCARRTDRSNYSWLTRDNDRGRSGLRSWQWQGGANWCPLTWNVFHESETVLGLLNGTSTTENPVWTLVWTAQGTFLLDTRKPQDEPLACSHLPATNARMFPRNDGHGDLVTYTDGEGAITLVDLARAPRSPIRARFIGHPNPTHPERAVRHLDFNRDIGEPRLLSIGGDGTLRLWRTDEQTEPVTIETTRPVRSAAITRAADTRLVACLEEDAQGSLYVWNLGVNAPVTPSRPNNTPCWTIALSHDESRLAVATEGQPVQVVSFPELNNPISMHEANASSPPLLAFSADGHLFGSCDITEPDRRGYPVCEWDPGGNRVHTYGLRGRVSSIQFIQPGPHEFHGALFSNGPQVNLFPTPQPDAQTVVSTSGSTNILWSHYLPRQNRFLSAHQDPREVHCQSGASIRGSIWGSLWDDDSPLCSLTEPMVRVAMGHAERGEHVFVTQTRTRVQVWDTRSGAELSLDDTRPPAVPESPSHVVLSGDSRRLVITASPASQVRSLEHALDAVDEDWRRWVCDALRRLGVPERPELDAEIEDEVRRECRLPPVTGVGSP